MANEEIRALLHGPGDQLWVGTQQGLWYRNGNTGRFQPLAAADGRKLFILCLQRDNSGKIWVGTNGHGAYQIDTAHMTMQALLSQDADTTGLNNLVINTILDLNTNEVWLGSSSYGIVAINKATLRTRRLHNETGLATSLADDAVSFFLRDRAGSVWVGTSRGISRYDPRQNAMLNLLSKPLRPDGLADINITAVQPMPDGSLWLGLRSKGVNIIHPERPIKQLPIDLKQPETALPSGAVRAFTLPIQGWVYFATNRGLYRSDIRGDHLQRVNMTQRDPAAAVVAMLQQERRLWLGGVDGLWLIDFAKGEPLQAQRVAGSEPLNKQLIMAVQADKQGRLWIGTRENGLVRFAPESGHLESIRANPSDPKALSSDSIASLLEDPQGRIWIATQGGGINVLSPSLGDHPQRIQRIGTQQGLPNNMVNKLLQDDKQQIWASTDDGLALIDPVSFSIRPLRMADGVPITTYWTNSGVKGLLGEMIFGGSGGITMVLPLRLKQSQNRPPLVVTRLELGGKTINTHPKPQPLLIHPQANRIAVEFSVLDYVSPKDNRYAYRLDGVDTDWNNSNPEQRLASYANLAPGKYLLRLRGSNQQGQWNEEELQIPVRVLPAWHQTWWWYLILVVLTGGGLWGVVHARTSYFRKRQIELKNLVAHRTTQLLQQAKTASLGTLTAGIAHEINNPSNFAHVGAYNLGTQLVEFQNLLTQLAGDDAPQDLRDTLQQHFDKMNVSLATISEGTSRIRDLVKDLRTFSRLDEAQIKSVAIADSLRATVNLVRTQYAGHVAIHCELAANPIIECSPAELNQVFMALIINACQAICARPPEVCALDPGVLVIRSNIEGDSLMFEFEDNGGGVPEAIRERIFDPFFTTKPVGEGMGMGLSISLGIIQKHRGAIKLKAIPGGSCFVVSLPLHEVVH